MSEIEIKTGLEGFVMLDGITFVDKADIRALRSFNEEPAYTGIEALAQAGAFHIRQLTGFERHIFLLKVGSCSIPTQPLNGEMAISGRLLNRSDSAFRCELKGEMAGKTVMEGEFFYAASDYCTQTSREILRGHYEKTFSCLLIDTNQD